ncbi:MAG: DUF790 family protein, partial [Polyangiaceae bacterium]|nr:DUF790 family protein [Polyangiaceae bacterium]
MLTADLVRARRQGGKLVLAAMKAGTRERAAAIGAELLALASENVGEPRGALVESFRTIQVGPREYKLAEGLKKLVLDDLEFEAAPEVEPMALREAVFLRASAARASLTAASTFDRA